MLHATLLSFHSHTTQHNQSCSFLEEHFFPAAAVYAREILEVAGQLAHVVVVDGVFVLHRFDFSRFLWLHEESLQCNVCVLERWVTVDVHGPLQLD